VPAAFVLLFNAHLDLLRFDCAAPTFRKSADFRAAEEPRFYLARLKLWASAATTMQRRLRAFTGYRRGPARPRRERRCPCERRGR
jgi:hypothetical protein